MATHESRPLIIVINPQPLQLSPPPPSSLWASSYPIIAISILGILTTAILLLIYYIFAIRCCLDRHRHDSITRLRLARSRMGLSRRADRPSFSAIYSSTTTVNRGLDESTIQAIPALKFRREAEQRSSSTNHECAVCLNEFQQDETIKLLPSCLHVFHVDCIGTWLQTQTNCPLCRSEVTSSSSLVIDVRDDENAIAESDESPGVCGNDGKLRKLPSMGDECVDVRGRGDRFGVQPVRRSFSVDSLSDQQHYRTVQEIVRQNQRFRDMEDDEGTSSGSRRSSRSSSLFSFGGHGRSSNQQ